MHGRKYRFRSPKNVLEELKLRSPIKNRLFFTDDNFIANPERAKRIMEGMIAENLIPGIGWGTQLTVEVIKDKEILKLMADSHCWLLYIGLESLKQESLDEFNKRQKVEEVKRCVEILHDYGIQVFGMFVLGSDHDTKETFRKTAVFCRETNIDYVQLTAYTPLPGTRLYEKKDREGKIITKDWSKYDLEHFVHKPALMSAYEAQVWLNEAIEEIYEGKRTYEALMVKRRVREINRDYLGFLKKRGG